MVFKNGMDKLLTEIAIMKKLNHQNISRIFEIINDPNKNFLYMGNIIIKYLNILKKDRLLIGIKNKICSLGVNRKINN